MKGKIIPLIVFPIIFLAAPLKMAFSAQQDRFTIKSPNGILFSEFRGYDAWQTVAVSRTANDIRAILGNPAMIAAYKSGIPGNGKPFPDGVKIAKVHWSPKKLETFPAATVPSTLHDV